MSNLGLCDFMQGALSLKLPVRMTSVGGDTVRLALWKGDLGEGRLSLVEIGGWRQVRRLLQVHL